MPQVWARASRHRQTHRAQVKGETMTTARMLIVEDERLIAQALRRRVVALGYTVVGLAASGEDAIVQATALW
jgi:PleD family two-component response regulator